MNEVASRPRVLQAAEFLRRAATRRGASPETPTQELRFGIDLGTATIVLCAMTADGEPLHWDCRQERAVRDGVVVDFEQAVRAVRDLAERAEVALGVRVESAATAHPPGVSRSDSRACRYVLEQAGIECRNLIDEVTAAQALLRVRDGAIVDVGGGSTGVGVFRNGEIVSLSDRPGGGHHLDLILAGALKISVDEAEDLKRTEGAVHLDVLTPGFERIAESVAQQCNGESPGELHLAGGACRIPGASGIVERYVGWKTVTYPHAELITPFGIALSSS